MGVAVTVGEADSTAEWAVAFAAVAGAAADGPVAAGAVAAGAAAGGETAEELHLSAVGAGPARVGAGAGLVGVGVILTPTAAAITMASPMVLIPIRRTQTTILGIRTAEVSRLPARK